MKRAINRECFSSKDVNMIKTNPMRFVDSK